MKKAFFVGLVFVSVMAMICSAHGQARLRMSTTTSTESSGLLKVLLPPFEKANNVTVDVISVGTGKALKLGEHGDVDVVFVHARPLEDKFVADGYGVDRKDVMYNDFILVGPKDDPSGVKGAKTAAEAFTRISSGKADFISRGDESGTHQMEKALWKASGIKPEGKWYVEAGQGMGAVLQMANEKKGYALADRGTFIAHENKIGVVILFDGDKAMFNPYGIIAVNPKKHPNAQYELAKKFINYVTGPEGQKVIADFKLNGKQLFFPDAK
ncbi:MAG: extracellular solute-binding protein [Desulfomonile tiedjei]|uniref:Extracellular solute-binding protein n=1 Tax=Desulfomonile tiedjei TaxID=2358 RepID=A0A9D6UXB5_9BACT|nr:extracellular solute-binding protein [Desulfomonile tiedjei]